MSGWGQFTSGGLWVTGGMIVGVGKGWNGVTQCRVKLLQGVMLVME